MFGTNQGPAGIGQDVNRLLNDLWSELGMVRPADAPAAQEAVTKTTPQVTPVARPAAAPSAAVAPKPTSAPQAAPVARSATPTQPTARPTATPQTAPAGTAPRPVAPKAAVPPQTATAAPVTPAAPNARPTAAQPVAPRPAAAQPVSAAPAVTQVAPVQAPALQSLPIVVTAAQAQIMADVHVASAAPLGFYPRAVRTLKEVGCSEDEVGRSALKLLAARGAHTGRKIAAHLKLMFPIVDEVLKDLRKEQFVVMKGEALAGDYIFVATDKGLTYAKEFSRDCTYFGATPVTLAQYSAAVKAQCVSEQKIKAADLKRAFHDLQLEDSLMQTLGPAVNSGRGMFLFGQPGNGKTSVAERVARSFGEAIWIPRALGVEGQIIRVYDPSIHEQVGKDDPQLNRIDPIEIDPRWVRVKRPTVVAGGELTMEELEVTRDANSGICEAPLQLKSNGGVLLIDDFGRQRMPVDELLNRWIIPLEKRYDLLNLPSGKKIQVPFDQLVIFSTNLEPKDLVDDAFLRRISYKIEVPDPTPRQFHYIFEIMCGKLGIPYEAEMVNWLIENHYVAKHRPMRACHPRDLLLQIKNLCIYEDREPVMSKEAMEFAVRCYFSVLG